MENRDVHRVLKFKLRKMKRIFYALMLTAGLPVWTFAQTTDPAPYCVASYDDGEFFLPRSITEVQLGTLTNVSGNEQFAAPHYVYYNNLTAPNLVKGQSYTLTVKTAEEQLIHFLSAFIDFNGNGQFDLPSEMVLGRTIVDDMIPNEVSVTFTIPADAALGTTRMRVMAFLDDEYTWSQNNPSFIACTVFNGGTIDSGETEDYNVNISGGSTVGVEQLSIEPQFVMVPNPSMGSLKITDAMKGAALEILSVDGSLLMQLEDVSMDLLDVSNLPKGTVIVRLYTQEKVIVQKVTLL